MTFPGHIYGIALNDRAELDALKQEFAHSPYNAPPSAPVVYLKPRSTVARAAVSLRPGEVLVAAATLALLFAKDATRCSSSDALAHVGAMSLAIDLGLPQASYYRPAIAQKNRDGFLAMGDWTAPANVEEIRLRIDGEEVHRWRIERLLRGPAELISDLSQFMTLRAGDVLLVGLPGDAPSISAGHSILAEAAGLPPVGADLVELGA